MPIPRFEVPSGAINGANTVFTVSVPYTPGSTAVFLNGSLLRGDYDDGWTESDPATGEVTLNEAPIAETLGDDTLKIFFVDTSPVLPETVVAALRGSLSAVSELEGRLTLLAPLQASVSVPEALEARLSVPTALQGAVSGLETLHGRLMAVYS